MEEQTTPAATWIEWVRQGLRAGTLRPVQHLPEGPYAWPMLLLVAATSALVTGLSRFEIEGPAWFDLRSWLFGLAPSALVIFGVWLVLSWQRDKTGHASPVAGWFLLFWIAMLPLSLVSGALTALESRGYVSWWSDGTASAWAIYAVLWIWCIVTTWRVSRAFARSTGVAVSLVAYVLVVQLYSSWYLDTQEWQPAGPYTAGDELPTFEISQETFEAQQALLQDALQGITPSTGGDRQAYGLIYAPYDEDVFLRESAMVQQVLETRFGARGRVVRLVNNSSTKGSLPWATTLNLKRSLAALADAMDTERDVLVVYLTSHGGADFKLVAQHWPLEVKALTADELRGMLDDLGVRNRVVAVSACYSGGWIEPLQSDDTLIMTAADKDHTSYGCGSRSDMTYFGRAVFDEQLRRTLSFEEAFAAAVPVIKEREVEAKKEDGFSNPQIAVGSNIRRVLDELVEAADRT
jgi:hypothetical protein